MTAARIWRTSVQVAVSAGLLYWVFRGVDLGRTFSFIGRADSAGLAGGVFFLFAAWLLKAVRLRYILLGVKAISLASILSSSIVGYMFNASLPAKSGNLAFAYWLGKKNAISKSTSLAAILLSGIVDAGALVCVAPLVLYFALPDAGPLRLVVWGAAGVVAGFGGALVGLVYQRERARRWTRGFVGLVLPSRAEAAADKIDLFVRGLDIVRERGRLAHLLWMSAGVVLSYLFRIYVILGAVGVTLGLPAVVVVWIFVNVGTVAPSFVGNVGPYEFMAVTALRLFGVGEEAALAAALLLHFLLLAPVVLAGLVCLWCDRFLADRGAA